MQRVRELSSLAQMNRRAAVAVTLGACGAPVAALWLRSLIKAADAERALAASLCATDTGSARAQRIGAERPAFLSFAGTRLFKEGFLDELGSAYASATGNRIAILGGGCDDGLVAVREKRAHIGGLCCPLEGGPASMLASITVAKDLKVIVANPGVPVASLSRHQLTSVLTGTARNWSAVGGADRPIALVLHDHCPDYVEPARSMLLGDRLTWSKEALYVKTDQKHLDTVARFETAVGVNSWILAEPYVRRGSLKLLAVDGITPSIENASAGRYRLIGPMNMVFSSYEEGLMQPFFDYLFSDAGRKVVSRRLVPVRADYSRMRKRAVI